MPFPSVSCPLNSFFKIATASVVVGIIKNTRDLKPTGMMPRSRNASSSLHDLGQKFSLPFGG